MIRIVVRCLFLFFFYVVLVSSVPNAFAFEQDTTKNTTQTSFVSWYPDGKILALAYRDEVNILDADTLETLNSFLVSRVQYTAPVWSPDGTLLAFGNDTDLEIWSEAWDSNSAHQVAVLPHDEPSAFGTISAAAWSPNGNRIASANGGYIKVWETRTWKSFAFLGGTWEVQNEIAWSPTGDRFAAADLDGSVAIWETKTYNMTVGVGFGMSVHPDGYIGDPAAIAVAWSRDEKNVLVGLTDGTIHIVDPTPTIPVLQMESAETTKMFYAHLGEVESIVWRPGTDSEIASASDDGTIKIWDIRTQELKQTVEIELPGDIWSIAWSPDGTKLAYGTPDRSVKIIEIQVYDDSSDVPKAGG